MCIRDRTGEQTRYLGRTDSLGVIAKTLAGQLRDDVEKGLVPVFYQPQVDDQGRITGAEALLRWRYGGVSLYPPLVVELAQEDECYQALTWSVLTAVCGDIPVLREALGPDIHVSANVAAAQLNDPELTERIIRLAEEQGAAGNLVLEVTEERCV